MRIGIITQPLRNNYGGILQNWALQQILIGMGHQPITVDAYELLPFGAYVKDLCRWYYYYVFKHIKLDYPHRYKSRNSFKLSGKFVEKNIVKTRPLDLYEERIIDDYGIDCVIVGSDQVWRPKYNPVIENMFLDFLKNRNIKKLVYAASFGTNEWEYSPGLTLKCSSLIQQFNAVSVREDSAVSLCREYLNVEALHVLDPTLLLGKDEYLSLCEGVQGKKAPFLAVYCLDKTDAKMALFRRLAKHFNLKLRFFSAHQDLKLTVPEWLAMFRDASAVVTDSFHGTVFSIIFEKQFFSILNLVRGKARVESLLDQLDLSSQIIDEDSMSYSIVNYSLVNDKLASLKRKSVQFLADHL